MIIIDFLPDDFKQRLRDSIVDSVARLAEKGPRGDKTGRAIRQLSSQATFFNAFDQAMESAVKRFSAEYTEQDEDLVEDIIADSTLWQSKDVRQRLMAMIQRPGSWLVNEREAFVQSFADVLPKRVNRERVDKAVSFFLQCVLEELWTLPGLREIREIYGLQFQRIEAEAAQQQVALLEAQLQATTQLSAGVREALVQLARMLEQRLLAAPVLQSTLPSPRPFHNLFQPDYTRFIGRQKELDWLRQRLLPNDRAWLIVITGIGGIGKSALALAIAHEYREHYKDLPVEERFEAIIWITAKEEILTIEGMENSFLPGLIFRTLEDMYTTIAQTLEREDITRAIPGEQDRLLQKALSAQRTLLIVDNIESVTDERVRTFLRNLPLPTKCIITSREWIDVADMLKLAGLPVEEAEKMIIEEASARGMDMNETQRQRLFERTSGLPLPIKLSVARMTSGETFDQVLRWLGDVTGNLPEYCVKGQIDIARQLNSNAWNLLLVCSLFDQDAGASREALGSIADLSMADRDDGLTVLQRLSLLNYTKNDRFWMLPMVQGYAGAELFKDDFDKKLTKRWLGWLLKFVQRYGTDLELHIERAAIIGSDYLNLLSAIRWCREHEYWKTLLRLAEGTWFYPYLIGSFSELREILEGALQASRELKDELCEVRFLRRLGEQLFELQGQDEKALTEYLEKAEEIANRYNDAYEIGRISSERSSILFKMGLVLEAEQLAKRTLEVGERLNNLELKILAASQFSRYASAQQQFDKALEWLDRGEKWSRDFGWMRGLAWLLYRRGTTLIQQGNAANAESFILQSLNLAASWNELRLVANNKHRRAQIYFEYGQLQLALRMANEARDLCERLGMVVELAEVEELLNSLPRKNGI